MAFSARSEFGQDDLKRRESVFRSLKRRNRVVGVLRYAIPGIGLAVAGLLTFQIILTNLARDYGISGLRIDKDQVIIDQPRYGGMTPDGARYDIRADIARVQVNSGDIINLEGAEITILQGDGYSMVAQAGAAQLNLSGQSVVVKGMMRTKDANNVAGELNDSVIDWPSQTLSTNGPVKFEFEDGAILKAQKLVYDAAISRWDFSGVVYTVPGDGGT